MENVNLILVFDQEVSKVLMCYRTKEPFLGRYNFPGGKCEANESLYEAAYRELREETGIKKIRLDHFLNITYIKDQLTMNIFYGVLEEKVQLEEEKHPLTWFSLTSNFDSEKFAGYGNIPYMINMALYYIKKEN